MIVWVTPKSLEMKRELAVNLKREHNRVRKRHPPSFIHSSVRREELLFKMISITAEFILFAVLYVCKYIEK